jgi:hypothetical protein
LIEILRQKTIENSGLKMNKSGDCKTLSNYIQEKHDEFISYNTLRRFFGVINSDIQPSSLTLDIISRFNGYKNYMHFSRLFKFNNKWKFQSDIYEIINITDSNLFIEKLENRINHSLDYVSIIVQVVRELILENRFDDVINVFSLKQLDINNISYDEVINVANGVGTILRKKKVEKNIFFKLLKVENYRNLVFTVYVDYSYLNGYYLTELLCLKKIAIEEETEVFSKCLENLYLYLNLEKIKYKKIIIKDDFHPILKSRIIAQELFIEHENIELVLEKYYQNITKSNLRIEHFYELIITSMVTKNLDVMRFIIKKLNQSRGEIFLYQLRHTQHYLLMKSIYFSSISDKNNYDKTIRNFNLLGVSESYKGFLKIFHIISMYNIENDNDKYLIEYTHLSNQLRYPLFSIDYIKNYNSKN